MIKEFIIKKSPLHKIILHKTTFEIINQQYKNESGIFSYAKLYNIQFKEKSTNHIATIAIAFINFFLPGPSSRVEKFKERIRMNYDGKERHFILTNFNKHTVKEAVSEIQKHINPKYKN